MELPCPCYALTECVASSIEIGITHSGGQDAHPTIDLIQGANYVSVPKAPGTPLSVRLGEQVRIIITRVRT